MSLMHGILGTVPSLTPLCSVSQNTIPVRHFTEKITEVSKCFSPKYLTIEMQIFFFEITALILLLCVLIY